MDNLELNQEQRGNLVKYVLDKCGLKNKTLKKLFGEGLTDSDLLNLLKEGSWQGRKEYIALFSEALRFLVPRKVKLKKLPESLPSREKIEAMMRGESDNLIEYKDLILALCRMPNRPPKRKAMSWIDEVSLKYGGSLKYDGSLHYVGVSSSNLGSIAYGRKNPPIKLYEPSTYRNSRFNSDFEYGLTDT